MMQAPRLNSRPQPGSVPARTRKRAVQSYKDFVAKRRHNPSVLLSNEYRRKNGGLK